ncbi:formate C-acetyltransferase/glycerol dehydratase family glycyl radical enzyme [uncultured Megasphaera sp.]|uniref:glycyl radical protein n=1 Tax=uncultured Megasphaera sp. TaxID=165188 RepID=UPI002658F0B0|nr:formate C-acetyltransferase/glycerol dehydratase family glycyl radical enzyme [uncultured Megasphaera sp.]
MEQQFYQMTDRVAMLKKMQADHKPSVSAERAKLATEAIQKYAFEPPVLQKAYMLDHILKNMTIFIQKGELIVGNQADKPRSCPVFPEYTSEWILQELDDFTTRKSDPMEMSDEDRNILLEVLPQWKGKSFDAIVSEALPESVKYAESCGIMTVGNRDCGTGHVLPNYYDLLRHGLLYYKEQCQKQIDRTVVDSQEKQKKVDFWKACCIDIDAAGAYAARYANLAYELAEQETNAVRKQELRDIAEACRQVPLRPARNFQEAVQFVWFIHVIMNIENNGHGESFHRFDQYTNDFYEADLAAGRITEDKAIEILECFFIKVTDIMKLRDKFYSQSFAGYPLWQNIIIGGQTADGKDATNAVSFLMLKANQAVQTAMPTMSVRWFPGLNRELIQEGIRMIQAGMSTPAFFNDELVVPMVQEKTGCTLAEARNWGIHGCVQPGVAGASDGRPTVGYVNHLKALELVMHNGVDPVTGKQLGPKTGDLESLDTLEKLQAALYTQIDYFMDLMIRGFNIVGALHAERMPVAFTSLLVNDCITKGKSLQQGGSRYYESGAFCVAVGNTADAVAAIDTLVNQKHSLSVSELMEAIHCNFKGKEDVRQMLLKKAPKYGNDNAYVDAIAADIVRHYAKSLEKYRDSRGGHFVEVVESQSMNVSQGKCVLASADGRFAYDAVNDNCSPAMGRDVSGPTACINSVAHLDQKNAKDGCLYNIRFDPRSIQGEKGRAVLETIIRTYFKHMGEHIQVNVVDDKTLRDAQIHPENYRNLLVRVAGYLAYFVELDSDVQEALIGRTAHRPDF